LGVGVGPAYLASFIPLVLGSLDILTGYIYGTVALLFILAATQPLIPQEYGSWINLLKSPLIHLDQASDHNKMNNHDKK